MGLVRRYTPEEVSRLLKDSEGRSLPNERGSGHAEGLHELVAVGKRRNATSVAELEGRVLSERKSRVGAFDGSQTAAVAFALNSHGGQKTLSYLKDSRTSYVFATVDVSSQNFRMKMSEADVPKIGPINQPQTSSPTVQYVAMKLMQSNGTLHIRTAYPLPQGTGGASKCQVFYRDDTPSLTQDLPI